MNAKRAAEHSDIGRPLILLDALNTVLDSMPMGIAVFDLDLKLRGCNRTFALSVDRYSPLSAEDVVPGAGLFDLIPGSETWGPPIIERVMAGETVVENEWPIEAGGIVSYWNLVLARVMEDGRPAGLALVSTDATERVLGWQALEQRVEERTREVERRQEVADGLHDILDILNSCCPQDQVLEYIITQASRLLASDAASIYRIDVHAGYMTLQTSYGLAGDALTKLVIPLAGGGIVGETIAKRLPMAVPDTSAFVPTSARLMPPEQQEMVKAIIGQYRSMLGVPIVVSDQLYGALTMFFSRPREFSDADVALASDLADHLALALENAELREQAEASAADAERSRLARDLHDAVTQTLFSASLIAEVLPLIWERDPAEGRRRLEELRGLTKGALAEMRTLLVELRPAALVEADLSDLLKQLAEATTGRAGVPVEFRSDGPCGELPSDVQVALYRIAQEALNNVARHSEAGHADVTLRQGAGEIELAIVDDGRGFESSGAAGEHLGIGIMRERAEAIRAGFAVDSHPGRGTRVRVTWRDRRKSGASESEVIHHDE